MGETLTSWSPACNGSINVQLSGDATTSDGGALLLREALDRSGVIEALDDHLSIPVTRCGSAIRWPASCAPSSCSAPWAGST